MKIKPTLISAYETKTRQAEIFRRAAAGEHFVVTRNGIPLVEISQAKHQTDRVRLAIKRLQDMQANLISKGVGGSHDELREIISSGRD